MELTLDGRTRLFLIAGDPIAQVKSPAGLSAILAARGVNALVLPAHVAAADFDAWLDGLALTRNLDGVVMTVPHKIAAAARCRRLSARAQAVGSVNVMRRLDGGGWWGDITDGQGMLRALASAGFDVAGKRALLIGAGGAGAAIGYELLARGAASLAIHDIDEARRDRLITRFEALFPGRLGVGGRDPRGHDLVANATPLGMRPGDALPFETGLLAGGQAVADVVTEPGEPPLIHAARAAGCLAVTGTAMFDAQAALVVETLLRGAPGADAATAG